MNIDETGGAGPRLPRLAVAVAVLGFVLRLALAIGLGLDRAPVPGTDEEEYDTYAWNVAQGRGYRGMSPDVADQDHLTAFRPPGPSLAYAACFAIVGHRHAAIRVLNCAAGAVAVWLTFAIGRRCFGEVVALLGAFAYACYPSALFSTTTILSEPLGTMWFLLFVLAALRFAEAPTWGRAALAGLLLGVAILNRPNPALMVPLLGVWALWQFRRDRPALLRALLIPTMAVATLIPWTVRNYSIFHAVIPISTMSGSGLLQGNNRLVATDPALFGYSFWDSKIPEYREALTTAGDEVERDRRAKALALEWLSANRDKWLFLARVKTVRAWTPFLQPHTPKLYRWGTLLSWGPILALYLIGVVPTLVGFLRRGEPGWLLHLAILNVMILNVIFWGEMRYRHSIEPICILIAAWTVARGVAFLRKGPRASVPDVTIAQAGA